MTPSAEQFASLLDRDRLTERLRTLVQADSENPPGNEKAAADLVAEQCAALGLEVSLHEAVPGRPSVIGRWKGGDGPCLTFCSHIDVVPAGDPGLWERDPFGAEISGGLMHGRGTCDAKGCCAASLEAVALMKAAGLSFDGTLEIALVADEETMGFQGAGHLVKEGILRPDVSIVGEPTSLRVVRAQRGACWTRITTRGKAAHGSAPERGVSAIKHMAEIVLRLEETLPDITHPLLGAPTISVGTITGGEKVNIIPAGCTAEVDRRTIPGETAESVIEGFEAAIAMARRRFDDIDASVEIAFNAQPFEVPAYSALVRHAVAAAEDALDREVEIIGFRGASDARFMADAGAEVILCGPGDIALAHTAREHLDLEELAQGALVYAGAFSRILGAR